VIGITYLNVHECARSMQRRFEEDVVNTRRRS